MPGDAVSNICINKIDGSTGRFQRLRHSLPPARGRSKTVPAFRPAYFAHTPDAFER